MNKCPLCNLNIADKKNSHIIPKFLGNPLFETIKHRYSIQLDKKGRAKKIQDIPKENFLICTSCEKRFEILETYFSKKLIGIKDYINRKDQFEIEQIESNKILKCLSLNPILFKLFCYSLIWRLSITSHYAFKSFQLSKDIQSEIGGFLNSNLFEKHRDLLQNLNSVKIYPKYHLLAFKPETNSQDFKGVLSALQMSKDHYGVFTSDMILFFHINENKIENISKSFSNLAQDKVKFILTNPSQWKEISSNLIRYGLLKNDK